VKYPTTMTPIELAHIAHDMNAMIFHSDATVAYDMMSDSLLWSDEIPPLGTHRPSAFWSLRPVLRYRTSIILGSPEHQYEEYWNEAKKCFPNWGGFHPSRCQENREYALLFTRRKSKSMRSLGLS